MEKLKTLCTVGDKVMYSHYGKEYGATFKKKKSRAIMQSLEKEKATHSSIFAWKISWTEEPGELQPMGSQRVRT